MALYLVTREGADKDEKPRLIEAKTNKGAIAFVAGNMFNADAIDTKTAHAFGAQGVKIEDANAAPETSD